MLPTLAQLRLTKSQAVVGAIAIAFVAVVPAFTHLIRRPPPIDAGRFLESRGISIPPGSQIAHAEELERDSTLLIVVDTSASPGQFEKLNRFQLVTDAPSGSADWSLEKAKIDPLGDSNRRERSFSGAGGPSRTCGLLVAEATDREYWIVLTRK